jgi:ubiquinone/menaquinone biosynthesis C-methylase UbiE
VYEDVFEPFSLQFAEAAIARLGLAAKSHVLDVGAGAGGAALALARRGCRVTAVDASGAMVARIATRAAAGDVGLEARVMDGHNLEFADHAFDAALSVFGVILFPDAVRGLAEMRRVTRPGGRVAVVTWTEPQAYELATELRAAMAAVRGTPQAGALPAQLRFREADACRDLFRSAGFDTVELTVHAADLQAPSAHWLVTRLAFAPGMKAMLEAAGDDRIRVLDTFRASVEAKQGIGRVSFAGRAFLALAKVT